MTYRSLISEVCRIHYRAGIDEEAKREASRIHIYFFLTAGGSKFLLLRVVVVLDAAVDWFVVMQKASQSSH